LGRLASELLAQAISRAKAGESTVLPRFVWTSKSMRARVDLTDKEAMRAALDHKA